jgi:hypothetical protein
MTGIAFFVRFQPLKDSTLGLVPNAGHVRPSCLDFNLGSEAKATRAMAWRGMASIIYFVSLVELASRKPYFPPMPGDSTAIQQLL